MSPPPRRSGARKRKSNEEEVTEGAAAALAPEPEDKKVKSGSSSSDSSSSNGAAAAAAAVTSPSVTFKPQVPVGKLILILSPAKTLDLSSHKQRDDPIPWTTPRCDKAKTNQLIRVMKDHAKSLESLQDMLGLSPKLAAEAKAHWDQMELYSYGEEDEDPSPPPTSPGSKPAIFAFKGVAYQGLDVDGLDTDALEYLQSTLRILDALYGWLRPMDVVQPYRLEMNTQNLWKNLQTAKSPSKLSEYWRPAIRDAIRQEANHVVVVNVASEEYVAAVECPPQRLIKVVFRHDGRVLAVHAKRARGLLVRYCALHKVTCVSQLQDFDYEGYRYQAVDSDETTLVFDRPANWETSKTE